MQTFLPFEDFAESARVLDRKRLGKQRVECKQIWNAMHRGGGWSHHPAVRMWRAHGAYFLTYYHSICLEWISRGYQHNMSLDLASVDQLPDDLGEKPSWLGDSRFHQMHRRLLYEKDPAHYGPLFEERSAWFPPVMIPRLLWPVAKDNSPIAEYAPWKPPSPRLMAPPLPRKLTP